MAMLPVLTFATAETLVFDSQDELERALTVRMRSAIAAGWALADVRPAEDGTGIGFTLIRDGQVERHVAELDGNNVYRVEPGTLPADPREPSALLLEALRGRGGVELVLSCGGYHEQPFFVEGFAAGPDAGALVARSLVAADDLEGAWLDGRHAVFQLEAGGRAIDLIVTLTEEGGLVEAELRRYQSRGDNTVYRRRGAMAHALRHAFVSGIRLEGRSLVLRTSRGRFAIDPRGAAFRARREDGGYEGCGC